MINNYSNPPGIGESSRCHKRIIKAKSKIRTGMDPNEWGKCLYKHIPFNSQFISHNITRIDYHRVNESEFYNRYERIPVLIENACENWPALNWTPHDFFARFAKYKFKVGQDDDGNSVYLRLKYFDQYCSSSALEDDSPLYIFDSSFPTRKPENGYPLRILVDEYSVPKYFRYDLFQYISQNRRPPYRWLVIGPERSGTGIHIDPLGTSAWNSVLYGHKRWCVFPPHIPKHLINPPKNSVYYEPKDLRYNIKRVINTIHDHEASTWFNEVYPNLVMYRDRLEMIEFIQHPGQTVYIPGGWFHVVCNLSLSIAVTQNFCSVSNFESVYLQTKRSRPKMTRKWRYKLESLAAQFEASSTTSQVPLSLDSSLVFPYLVHTMQCLDTVPTLPSNSSSSDSSTSESDCE